MLPTSRKISFITTTPFLAGDVERFSLDELIDMGYDLSFVDATPALEPKMDAGVTAPRISERGLKYYPMRTPGELRDYIGSHREHYFFLMFDRYYEVRKVYDYLTEFDCDYGNANCALTDNMISAFAYRKGIASFNFERLAPRYWKRIIYNRLIRKRKAYKPANFVLIGGTNGEDAIWENCATKEGVTKGIRIRSYDYERFLRAETFDNGGRPYALFLDQYIPFHPDKELHYDIPEPDIYFKELHDILDEIRDRYGLEILVAPHPRGDYRDKEHYWKGCRLIYGKSAELAKGASLVLGHYSNALSFAVMADVPSLLLHIPCVAAVDYMNGFDIGYRELLGAPFITCGADLHKTNDYTQNREKYEKFRSLYTESAPYNGKSFWQTAVEEI
ncbi:MAG: hypothetical protein J6N76_03160 [Lachnospiraceae bacterium]|nr:hypothetical protein [Lachnospiraceae bacterium]